MVRRCECGTELDNVQVTCHSCGKTMKLDPLVSNYRMPDPPVNKWAEEQKTRTYSEESLREVMEQAKDKSQKKKKFKFFGKK